MDIISVSNARIELFNLIKDVNKTHKPVQIVNKNGASAVLLSAEDWSAIEETIYLNSIPGLVEKISAASEEPAEQMTKIEDVEW